MKRIVALIIMTAVLVPVADACWWKRKRKKKLKANHEVVSVGIHRTVCFGSCPDYTIDVNKNGTVTYTANRFTPDTGIFVKTISKEKAREIIGLVEKYRADTCREMYENRIPDLPGLNVKINFHRNSKTIYSANFGPKFLTEIATEIDEVGKKTDNEGWKKIGMPKLD